MVLSNLSNLRLIRYLVKNRLIGKIKKESYGIIKTSLKPVTVNLRWMIKSWVGFEKGGW